MSDESQSQIGEEIFEEIKKVVLDPSLIKRRHSLALFSAKHFDEVGIELQKCVASLDSANRVENIKDLSKQDEIIAVSVLLLIASQLVSASNDLFLDGRHYSAAALLRQLVEVEYLAWAFDTRDGDAERWLRSDEKTRQDFFKPSKLRKAALGKFRGKDYGYHCELGGHPVPKASILLRGDEFTSQLLLADLLGHVGRIWDHLVQWSYQNNFGQMVESRNSEMSGKFQDWRSEDPFTRLPPPP